MINYQKVVLVLLLEFLLTVTGMAQRRPIIFTKPFVEDNQSEFRHFTTDDGLSNDRITDLLQDKRGYIWIATLDGLNKYDGKSFHIFKPDSSNPGNRKLSVFTSLTQSAGGKVYTGTEKGLFWYDRKNNQLKKVNMIYDTVSFSDANVRDVLYHRDTLWVLLRMGKLLMFNLKTNMVDTVYKLPLTDQPYYYYHSLYMDKANNLWFSDRNIYPMRLSPKRDKLIRYISSRTDYSKKRESDASGYLEDSQNRFWVSGLDGVYQMNRKTGVFSKFIRPSTWCIAEDKKGIIWFGTGMGLLKYDPLKNEMISYSHKKDNPASISSNNVYQILFDKAGNIWLATGKGLNVISVPKYPFNKFVHLAGVVNSPAGNSVSAVAEDKNGNLWIGYDKEGMDYFNRKSGIFTHYKHDKNNPNSLAGNKVSDLCFDSEGKLWIGLWQGIGFNIYNPETGKFTLITYDKKSFAKDWYNDFIEAGNDKMYIGFWGGEGLTRFDKNSLKFEKFYGHGTFDRSCCRLITRLEKDDRNNIWFGTTDCGLYRVNHVTDETASYYASDSSGLMSDEINDLLFSNGDLWVLNDYLQKYDAAKDTFITYGKNVFLSYSLKAMLRDDNGNFWISTGSNGLLVFDTEKDSLLTGYCKYDGLQSNKFNDARYKLSTGELFFGGQKGFNLFNPAEVKCTTKLPEIFFGRFLVSGKVRYYETTGINTIYLQPKENTFTIDLLNDDMINPEQYNYEVKLTGYDMDWVKVSPKTREIRYTAVPFGSYQLLYRITDSKGNSTVNPVSVKIIIATPFTHTLWFYALVFIVVATLVTAFYKIHYDKLKTKHHNLDLKERLFRLQVNPHFLFNSLIAIQNYILNHKAKDAGLYLSNFARFFRIMLESSQTESIPLETEINMVTLYMGLQQIRYPGKFEFKFEVDEALPVDLTHIPAMIVQPILENAIEHGFRGIDKKGLLTIRFRLIKNYIRFEVEDNGVGVTASKKFTMPHKNKHNSSAIAIIKERALVLSKKYKFPMLFEIEEIVNNNRVEGTIVRMNLPLITGKFIKH